MFFYYQQPFSYEKVSDLLKKGYAVDAKEGGLVLGRSHENGGVYFLSDFGTEYRLMGELEGFEYVLSMAAQILLKNDFDNINDSIRDKIEPFQEYKPHSNVRIIDTFLPSGLEYETKLILFEGLFGGQPIINKYSTKVFLDHIDEVNRRYKEEYDHESYFLRTRIKVRDSISGTIIEDRPIIYK